ncbi:GDSL-type esterase/lipase family protein [Streptomyces gilvus]|uniref:GDSL-type esterase/lipase family protein n=1 Tax=Streptomyces gilvus TaxID=2920937 RepID=UPI001F0DEF9C|nr:GDSL-type esterase/lipase family protein [Streptomyces sp. CME 23]MCH5677412.1 GDSL-type esterase/lipase family protein [Streptomyces sp. CME 23]
MRAERLGPALALEPDLANGRRRGNDACGPGSTPTRSPATLEATFAALTARGARVAALTFPHIGRIAPPARSLAPRVLALNAPIREAARRHGVVVADSSRHPAVTDPRLWSADRRHAGPQGHALIAAALAHALALPDSDDSWTRPLPPGAATRSGPRAVGAEGRWAGTFLGPWIVRRVRGRSRGEALRWECRDPVCRLASAASLWLVAPLRRCRMSVQPRAP